MSLSDNVGSILNALISGAARENKEAVADYLEAPFFKEAISWIEKSDPCRFRLMFNYPISRMTEGLIATQIPHSREARFLFQQADFVEGHIRRVIEDYEGIACCADKTRTVMRSLARKLKDGVPIGFDYTQEYTYHLPTKVLANEADILRFFKAVHQLFYGHGELYVEEFQRIKRELGKEV